MENLDFKAKFGPRIQEMHVSDVDMESTVYGFLFMYHPCFECLGL